MLSLKKLVTLASCLVITASFYAGLSIKKIEAYQTSPIAANTDATRNRQLLWVYNADSNGHAVGDVLVWTDGSIADGLEVAQTTTANNALVAGVVAIASMTATSWGWIQTRGYHGTVTCDSSVAAGENLVTSTTAEAATTYTVAMATGTSVSGQADRFGVFGVALADDASSVCQVLIQ